MAKIKKISLDGVSYDIPDSFTNFKTATSTSYLKGNDFDSDLIIGANRTSNSLTIGGLNVLTLGPVFKIKNFSDANVGDVLGYFFLGSNGSNQSQSRYPGFATIVKNNADGSVYNSLRYDSYAFSDTYIHNKLNTTYSGLMTFSTLPKSSVVPSEDTHLVNKKYVDDSVSAKQDIIQYNTMPTASSTTVGKIIQYIGATDSTYTNGYFYIGVTDGESTPTYSWEQIDLQPESGGIHLHNAEISLGSNSIGSMASPSHPAGVYILSGTNTKIKHSNNHSTYSPILSDQAKIIVVLSTINTYTQSATIFRGSPDSEIVYLDTFMNQTVTIQPSAILKTSGNQTISGTKTFSTLPESSVTPTTDNQLVNKAYVDNTTSTVVNNIAPAYSSSSTYAVGDYVSYQGALYVCNTDIDVAEEWTAAHWTSTTVASIIGDLKSQIGNISAVLATLTTPASEEESAEEEIEEG